MTISEEISTVTIKSNGQLAVNDNDDVGRKLNGDTTGKGILVNGDSGKTPERTEDDEDEGVGEMEKEVLVEIEPRFERTDNSIPDGGWGWAVVCGGVIIHIFIGGFMKSSGVMYLKLKDEFNQSAVATAWVFSLFTTFLLMMGPIASALCHRFSCRTVVMVGGVLCFVGIVMSAYSPNIEFLYFSYCVIGGFGRCMTYTPSLILVTEYFNKRRGLAVGITTAGVGLGMFSFPPLIGKLAVGITTAGVGLGTFLYPPFIEALFGNYGYKWAMLLLAAISLESCVCAALFRSMSTHKKITKVQRINSLVKDARRGSVDARKEVEALTGRRRKTAVQRLQEEKWQGSNIFSSTTEFTYVVPEPRRKSVFYDKVSQFKNIFKKSNPDEKKKPFIEFALLKDFPFLTLCLAIMLFTMSMMATFVFLPPLAKSNGVTQMQSSYLVSIMGVSDSCARFASGVILDMKRVKQYRLLVYNGVMFGVGIISMLMPSMRGFPAYAAMSACYGVLCGIYVAQKSVVVVDMLGVDKMASAYGLLLAFQGIGSLIGPTIAGLFRDVFGTYTEAFYFGGIGIFSGGVVLMCGNIWRIIRKRRELRAAAAV